MLRCVSSMIGYKAHAIDGEVGKAHDFYFDDTTWTIRHLVVNTGTWLNERLVLVPPAKLGQPLWEERRFPIDLAKDQIEHSPDVETDLPVSRQKQEELYGYYDLVPYWSDPAFMGAGLAGPIAQMHAQKPAEESDAAPGDPRLRSACAVSGYAIRARDGEIGHVEDFIVEEGTWIIRYMIVDTRNWLPGKKVLVVPAWIERIDWNESSVHVGLARDAIRNAPEFDPEQPVNRQYETRYYDYYGQPRYWESSEARAH